MPVATKFFMVVTYLEELLPLKSWSRDLARWCGKLKPLYLHYNNVLATKIFRVVTYLEELPPIKSLDKLKRLYLHRNNTCGHQTW